MFKIEINNFLEHHGIKGQRWGVRRTPEQLGHKKPSKKLKVGYAELKYQDPRKQIAKKSAIYLTKSFLWSLIPGSSYIIKLKAIKNIADKSMDSKDFTALDGPEETVPQMKKKTQDFGIDDDMKRINPRTPGLKNDGTVNNCAYCALALEMRRRGYDVRARRKSTGVTLADINYYFSGVKIKYAYSPKREDELHSDYVTRSYDNLCQTLEQQGSGARGLVIMKWMNTDSGHIISYDVDASGNVNFYDSQNNKKNDLSEFSMADPDEYCYARLDVGTPTKNIGHAVVSTSDTLLGRRKRQ